MFEFPWRADAYPQTRAAGERAFGILLHHVEAFQADEALPPGDPMPYALIAWSMVHGVAKLAINGRLPLEGTRAVLNFADTATNALWKGLGEALSPGS